MLNLVHPWLLHQYFTLLYTLMLLPLAFPSGFDYAKPECPSRCGNLTIPFPFGVGSDCSLDPSFDLLCKISANSAKAYLSMFRREVEVIEIYPSWSQIRVRYPYLLTGACYNNTSVIDESFNVTMSGTQYTFADENWITAIGCDDSVVGVGEGSETFGSGCVSYCWNANDPQGFGYCPDDATAFSAGIGCCRIPIPRGMISLRAQLTDLNETRRSRRLFPCSYAFIQERGIQNQSQFRYPLYYLNNSTAFVNYDDVGIGWKTSKPLMVRLDWRIGAENCSQARLNSTAFACGDNSDCIDYYDASIGGYLCSCSDGYEGNPYLTGGCQDIDECDESTLTYPCASNSICNNTHGSFTCSCQEGYAGDGTKNGTGCTRSPQSKTLINTLTGLGSGLGFLLLLAICFWLHKVFQKRKHKKRKEKFFKRNGGLLLQQQQTNEGSIGKTEVFSSKALETATDHFNESRILGKGGQGTVYKGMLSDGKIVAIKKSKLVDKNFLEQFINEVAILSQINHRNVVKLLGCCLETEVPMLVYEFLPNGTLFDLIHNHNTEFPFTWNVRLRMAIDIAGALAYIHSASSIPIYHRDIKSSNILLDEKYIVKIADFGMSRTVAVDQTHLTTMVKGTFGYFDPEYFQSRQYSEKSEVYSFGVVLAELLSGKRPIFRESEEEKGLATCFRECIEQNNIDAILDDQVSEHGRKEEMIAVARLGQRCLNLNRKMRPTMKEVAIELESLRMSQVPVAVDESEEERIYDANTMMISDSQYTWKTNYSICEASSSSSDTHPVMCENL